MPCIESSACAGALAVAATGSWVRDSISEGMLRLQGADDPSRQKADGEIKRADKSQRLDISVIDGTDIQSCGEQLEYRDGRKKRALLEHADDDIAQNRHDRSDGLRQDDAKPDATDRQAEGERRLSLTGGKVLDAGAKDFGCVGAIEQPEPENARGQGGNRQAPCRQHIVQEVKLDQQRGAANEVDEE